MRLYIIRHADPDYPNNTITAAGHLEAKALSVRMKQVAPDEIFASPLGRARDTARYTAEALGLTPTVLPWTAELDWPGISQEGYGNNMPWDLHAHVVRQWPHEVTRQSWVNFAPLDHPGYRAGFAQIQKDSDAFLTSLGYQREGGIYRVVKGNPRKIAVFCHGGFGLSWLAHLLEIPLPLMVGLFPACEQCDDGAFRRTRAGHRDTPVSRRGGHLPSLRRPIAHATRRDQGECRVGKKDFRNFYKTMQFHPYHPADSSRVCL